MRGVFPIISLLFFILSLSCAGKEKRKNEQTNSTKVVIGENDTYEFEHLAGAIELLPMVLAQRESGSAATFRLEVSSGKWFKMQCILCRIIYINSFSSLPASR